jgi:ribosomal RNA-processing protein 9
MPDSFFSAKSRKRPRPNSKDTDSNRPNKLRRQSGKSSHNARPSSSSITPKHRKKVDEELESDQTDDGPGVDDLELRADSDSGPEDTEDATETPAEKRLRLAKLHLENIKDGLVLGTFLDSFLHVPDFHRRS